MKTRTVCVACFELDDYCEWLAAQAWPVIRIKEHDHGREFSVTFAYSK